MRLACRPGEGWFGSDTAHFSESAREVPMIDRVVLIAEGGQHRTMLPTQARVAVREQYDIFWL